MSIAIVVFRANRQEEEKPIQYNQIDSVQPFGAQAIAIGTADGTIILPWGRIKEVILPTDKAHDTATNDLPEIVLPDGVSEADFEEIELTDAEDAQENEGGMSAATNVLSGEAE